jgi:hypothetical protein
MKDFLLNFTAQFTLTSVYTQVSLFVAADSIIVESELIYTQQSTLIAILQQINIEDFLGEMNLDM